jgi:hypothetical protein
VRTRGGEAVSADPAYARPAAEIAAEARVGLEHGIRYLDENRDSYDWTFFSSVEDLRRRRGAALDEFVEDFAGPDSRYVVAAPPALPFGDRAFRLVLSAYLLFAYPDHLDEGDHERSLRELLRVAREEVRVFPLIDTAYARYPALDGLRRRLAAGGADSEVRRVGLRVPARGRRGPRAPRPRLRAQAAARSSLEKNVRAVRVFVCCLPVRSIPRSVRSAFVSRATGSASPGAHLVDSSRIRAPSG